MKKINRERKKLSVLIPVFNEGVNLKMMIRFIESTLGKEDEILILYDFDEDDSVPVVKKLQTQYSNLRLVKNGYGRGVANAIKTGLNEAKGKYAFIMTADDSGPLISLEKIIKLMDEGCDIVGCTRYSYGGRVYGGSFIERILSRMANKIFYSFGSRTFTDSTNGIKMLRISKFKNMEFKAKVGWSIGFELAIISQRENMRLGEVPMISINRFYGGKSSFSVGPWIIEYLKFFFRGFKEVRKSGNRKVMRI